MLLRSAVGCSPPATTRRWRNPEAAIEPATKAVELAPDDGKCWAGLGMAYYRAGQWQDALRALDQASRRPQAAGRIDLFFLAMTHWQLDHKEDARRRVRPGRRVDG